VLLYGGALFPQKVDDFLVVVTFKPTLKVQTFKTSAWKKIGSLAGGPWRRGPPPIVQPAQWLIRPCQQSTLNARWIAPEVTVLTPQLQASHFKCWNHVSALTHTNISCGVHSFTH